MEAKHTPLPKVRVVEDWINAYELLKSKSIESEKIINELVEVCSRLLELAKLNNTIPTNGVVLRAQIVLAKANQEVK